MLGTGSTGSIAAIGTWRTSTAHWRMADAITGDRTMSQTLAPRDPEIAPRRHAMAMIDRALALNASPDTSGAFALQER